VTRKVVVKDWLIVSLGDSFASGEGNPDVVQRLSPDPNGFGGFRVAASPTWIDRRCHRSAASAHALAAMEIEKSDPHTSVTFLSFACSGASISEAMLGTYAGIEPADPPLPSQIDQVVAALTTTRASIRRSIDFVLMSIGGNDFGFGKAIELCSEADFAARVSRLPPPAGLPRTPRPFCSDPGMPVLDLVSDANLNGMNGISVRYGSLASRLNNHLVTGRAPKPIIYISEYPDPTSYQDGHLCGEQGPRPLQWRRRLLETPLPESGLYAESAKWVRDVFVARLNEQVRQAATKSGWTYVGGIVSAFQRHGECADVDRWFNTEEDARRFEGPWSPFDSPNISRGTIHPNKDGQRAVKERILAALQPSMSLTVQFYSPGVAVGRRSDFVIFARNWLQKPIDVEFTLDNDPSLKFKSNVHYSHTFYGQNHSFAGAAPGDYVDVDDFRISVPPGKLHVRVDPYPVKLGTPADFTVWATDDDGKPVDAAVQISNPVAASKPPATLQYRTNTLIRGVILNKILVRHPPVGPGDPVGDFLLPAGTVRHPDFETEDFDLAEKPL